MLERKSTAQWTGPRPRGRLGRSHLHQLPRPPSPRAPSVGRTETGGKRGPWRMRWAATADAASLSLQVSWHIPALPEPAARRSLLPGARSSPFSITVQDLALTPQELGTAFSRSWKPLPTPHCLQLLMGHRDSQVQERPRSWRPRGGKSSSLGRATAIAKGECWDPLEYRSPNQNTYLSHPGPAK